MIITCASSKGGVGKSTTVACLAGAFAHAEETVPIVDLDNNRTVSRWFGDASSRTTPIPSGPRSPRR
jgi:cellulose biosynthesis protein BcsQ